MFNVGNTVRITVRIAVRMGLIVKDVEYILLKVSIIKFCFISKVELVVSSYWLDANSK